MLSFNQFGEKMDTSTLSILGCGNIGSAIAQGLKKAGKYATDHVILTKRKVKSLDGFQANGFQITNNNIEAVKKSSIVIITVGPSQLMSLLQEITPHLNNHLIISVVSGVKINEIPLIGAYRIAHSQNLGYNVEVNVSPVRTYLRSVKFKKVSLICTFL